MNIADRMMVRLTRALAVAAATAVSGIENVARRAGRLPLISAALSLAAVIAFLLPATSDVMRLDRAAFAGGQYWRAATCHWAHWNFDHLIWDLGAFLLLGILCERRNRRGLVLALAAAVIVIPAAVLVFLPGMHSYCGLSGLDSALFALLAAGILQQGIRDRRALLAVAAALALAAFAGKIGFELLTGTAFFVDSRAAGFVPVPLAHAVGAAAGFAASLLTGRPKIKTDR